MTNIDVEQALSGPTLNQTGFVSMGLEQANQENMDQIIVKRNSPTPRPESPSSLTYPTPPNSPQMNAPFVPRPLDIYDFALPATAVSAILLLFVGPLYIPRLYLFFLIAYFVSFVSLSLTHCYKWSKSAASIERTILKAQDQESQGLLNPTASYLHIFIIPNYEEPIELLRNTINRLAQHKLAKNHYALVLAMEESERGHEQKAALLYGEFRNRFKEMIVSVHPSGLVGEARGKASNVNWAVRFANSHLRTQSGIPLKHMFLTISDADSAIPEIYIPALEKAIRDCEDPYMTMFSPPMVFSRNSMEVPAAVRVTDYIWSVMVAQNLSNARGINFPCSTYSLSMVLADKVGYWDTTFDGIGEDMHMFLKIFYSTGGQARGYPVWVPINLTNVQTETYATNLWARYVQARRHYYGSADVGYALRCTFKGFHPFQLLHRDSARLFMSKLLCCFHVLEAHLIPISSGWLMFLAVPVLQLCGGVGLYKPDSFLVAMFWTMNVLSIGMILPMIINVILYEKYIRVVDKELFGKRVDEPGFRTLRDVKDYIWLPVGAVVFMTIPSTLSCLKNLVTGGREQQYVVADKSLVMGRESDKQP